MNNVIVSFQSSQYLQHRMKMYIFLIFILYIFNAQSVETLNEVNYTKEKQEKNDPKLVATFDLNSHVGGEKDDVKSSVKKELITAKESSKDTVQKTSSNDTGSENFTSITYKSSEVETGAVMRGVFVFVGIGLLFIIYLGCKTYNRKKKPTVMIKKYGIRTKRSDVEMEPLPLDEDDEDETLFDVGNINRT